jgi:heat shock protein HslJ
MKLWMLLMAVPIAAAGQGLNRVLPPIKQGKKPLITETVRGRQWNLATLMGKPAIKGRSAVPYFFMELNSNRLNGSGGVNRFVGTYVLTSNHIKLNPGAMTKMAGTQEANQQEMAFVAALSRANSYKLQGNGLSLMAGGKTIATFSGSARL